VASRWRRQRSRMPALFQHSTTTRTRSTTRRS
jgi:hypothetical protein